MRLVTAAAHSENSVCIVNACLTRLDYLVIVCNRDHFKNEYHSQIIGLEEAYVFHRTAMDWRQNLTNDSLML